MGEQKVEQTWELPPHDRLASITRGHVAQLEASSSDKVWKINGLAHLVLTTVGRRTGATHKVALSPWFDAEGRPVVAATSAGHTKDPAWFLNVRDRTEPEVHCRVQTGAFWAETEILDGEEYDRIWASILEDRDFFADYRTTSGRVIPLVRLIQTRPA
jgi:deazaflavin-dependent oxidoreductase (nitroreductase family)